MFRLRAKAGCFFICYFAVQVLDHLMSIFCLSTTLIASLKKGLKTFEKILEVFFLQNDHFGIFEASIPLIH